MGDVESLVARARDLVADILRVARGRLLAGADVARVHESVSTAAEYLQEIETYALLARAGNGETERAIERRLIELGEITEP
jgi:hypothetical protein